MYHISSCKIHARMIELHQNCFIESIPYVKINPDKIQQNRSFYNNIDGIENKLIHFQMYPESELASNFTTPFYKTQYSEIFVEH